MLIDGDPVEPVGVKEVLKPEQTHIQPKYVIGGRWLGTYQKYTDFFNGKISQMVFSRSHVKVIMVAFFRAKQKFDLTLYRSFHRRSQATSLFETETRESLF